MYLLKLSDVDSSLYIYSSLYIHILTTHEVDIPQSGNLYVPTHTNIHTSTGIDRNIYLRNFSSIALDVQHEQLSNNF